MKTYILTELDIRMPEKKVRKLNENLNERSKQIESSSTTDAWAIELMEMTSKDIDTTVKGVDRTHPLLNLVKKTSYYHSENYRG